MDGVKIENAYLTDIEKIEKETGVRIPNFVSNLPAIDREKAADLALQFDLVDKQWLVNRYGSAEHESFRWHAAKAGLSFCRDHHVDIDDAFKNAYAWERTRTSALQLFERYLNPTWDRSQLAESEKKRRETRDLDILHLETDLLRKRGIRVPDFLTLIEYCSWIPTITGINKKYRQWGWEMQHDADTIYWDLMGHYSQIIEGAQNAFDPLNDFILFLKGKKDIKQGEEWHLQNMGVEDITYYSMSMRWGGGARTRSAEIQFQERLLTHSTSLNAAQSITESSRINPQVCMSAGRVISGYNEEPRVTFIFDRDTLTGIYSIRQYGEAEHEKEVRCQETVHPGFAIGCVPMTRALFPDTYGASQGTLALGDETIRRWEANYLKTGILWDDDEIKKILEIARTYHAKD